MLGYSHAIGAGFVANCAGESGLFHDAQPNKNEADIVAEKNIRFFCIHKCIKNFLKG